MVTIGARAWKLRLGIAWNIAAMTPRQLMVPSVMPYPCATAKPCHGATRVQGLGFRYARLPLSLSTSCRCCCFRGIKKLRVPYRTVPSAGQPAPRLPCRLHGSPQGSEQHEAQGFCRRQNLGLGKTVLCSGLINHIASSWSVG